MRAGKLVVVASLVVGFMLAARPPSAGASYGSSIEHVLTSYAGDPAIQFVS